MGNRWSIKKLARLIAVVIVLQSFIGISAANADCVSVNDLRNQAPADGLYVTCGGDDLSYRVPIQGPFIFQGLTYDYIWATTNSDFILNNSPDEPWSSGSSYMRINGSDLVALGFADHDGATNESTVRSDEFFNIEVRNNATRVDLSGRFFGTYYENLSTPVGALNHNVLRLDVASDRTISIRYFIDPANGGNSGGYQLSSSCVVADGNEQQSLEACGVTQVYSLADLNLGAPVGVIPTRYLVLASPVTISQTSDAVICHGASLKEVNKGLASDVATLTSQNFSLLVDGQVVAKSTKNEKNAVFMKKDLPSSGIATCSQVAEKNGLTMSVSSLDNSWNQDLAKDVNVIIKKIKNDYSVQAKKLMDTKLSHLNSMSGASYREATLVWATGLLEAKVTRDAAIKAAYANASKAANAAGMQIDLNR